MSARRAAGATQIKVLSKHDLQQRAEQGAQEMLGVTARTAFKWLDGGKLRGTIAEAELKSLRLLLETA
jgi:hypothetical protein